MENLETTKTKPPKSNTQNIVFIIMIVLGGLLLLFGLITLCIHLHNKYSGNYAYTEATITYIEEKYDSVDDEYEYIVHIKYTVDGVEYNNIYGSYSHSMQIGKTITIMYLKSNPNKIMSPKSNSYLFIIVLGTLFAGIGIYMLLKNRYNSDEEENGTVIVTKHTN